MAYSNQQMEIPVPMVIVGIHDNKICLSSGETVSDMIMTKDNEKLFEGIEPDGTEMNRNCIIATKWCCRFLIMIILLIIVAAGAALKWFSRRNPYH